MFQQQEPEEQENTAGFENYPFQQFIPQMTNKDNLILQTSPERVGEILEHQWRGESWDDAKNLWDKKKKAIMNDLGIDTLITFIKSFLTQNSTLSNITEKMAKAQAITFGYAVINMVAANARKWDLDKSNRTPLVLSVTCIVYNVLTRSLGKVMSDKEMYATTIQSAEHTLIKMDQDRQKRANIWSAIAHPFQRRNQ